MADIDRDKVNPAGVSATPDASLQEEIVPCLDEVSPSCHIGDAPSLAIVIGDQDNQEITLGRIEELEPLLANLDPITHIDDLEE